MNTIKNAVNHVTEKAQGAGSQASKEANKSVAKDSHAPIGTRMRAAKDAMGDKVDQHRHETNAEVRTSL